MNPKLPTKEGAEGVGESLNFHDPEIISGLANRGMPRDAPFGYESMEHYYAVQQGRHKGPWTEKHQRMALGDTPGDESEEEVAMRDTWQDDMKEQQKIREMGTGGASAPSPMIPDQIKHPSPSEDDIHRKSADIAFSQLYKMAARFKCNKCGEYNHREYAHEGQNVIFDVCDHCGEMPSDMPPFVKSDSSMLAMLADKWFDEYTCECNAEDDALEGLSEEEVHAQAFSPEGHPRRLKWQKASDWDEDGNYYSKCGHCGVSATLDMQTMEWIH